jgi:hypothetical protein
VTAPSVEQFEVVKRYILARGDRQTYCAKYNHNPHAGFAGFDAYLDPSIGQGNINCDPRISDFDELVIHDRAAPWMYASARLADGALACRPDVATVARYFAAMLAEIAATRG